MTIKELSEYYNCTVLIKNIKQEIKHLESCSAGTVANYSGVGGGNGKKLDNVYRQAENIAEQKEKLRVLLEKTQFERERIHKYIFETVAKEDGLVANMMYNRFILHRSWYRVAIEVGGNNTADSCRMRVFRYCKKNKEQR